MNSDYIGKFFTISFNHDQGQTQYYYQVTGVKRGGWVDFNPIGVLEIPGRTWRHLDVRSRGCLDSARTSPHDRANEQGYWKPDGLILRANVCGNNRFTTTLAETDLPPEAYA
jgi:hypothetical protein